MKKDKHSKNIRLAIVATVLLIAPGALAIGEFLRTNLEDVKAVEVTTEIPLTVEVPVQEE